MDVIWKDPDKSKSPILFSREACIDDFCVRQVRVVPGELPEYTTPANEINITLDGNLFTQGQTAGGSKRCDIADSESMCMMPVGQTVAANWDAEYENLAIDFSPKLMSKIANEMNLSTNIELRETVSKKDYLIQNLSMAFLSEAEAKGSRSKLYSDSLVHTLMYHLVRNYTNAVLQAKQFLGGLSGSKLRRVTDFINDNLEQDLTLSEIADVAGLSHFHFARAFRKTVGETPIQYITKRRIEKAKQLLSQSDMPIVEVGFQTGFKNQSHFTSLFRKFTNFTPKIWREAAQS